MPAERFTLSDMPSAIAAVLADDCRGLAPPAPRRRWLVCQQFSTAERRNSSAKELCCRPGPGRVRVRAARNPRKAEFPRAAGGESPADRITRGRRSDHGRDRASACKSRGAGRVWAGGKAGPSNA